MKYKIIFYHTLLTEKYLYQSLKYLNDHKYFIGEDKVLSSELLKFHQMHPISFRGKVPKTS